MQFPLSLLLPDPHTHSSPLPQIHSSSVSLQKIVSAPGLSTEHCITSYSKTKYKSSYQSGARQTSRRKRVPRAGIRVRDTHMPTLKSSKNHQSNNCNVYADALVQTQTALAIAAPVSLSPYEPCVAHSVGCVLLVS